jgi:hypothetical protein
LCFAHNEIHATKRAVGRAVDISFRQIAAIVNGLRQDVGQTLRDAQLAGKQSY